MNKNKYFKNIKKSNCIFRPPKPEDFQFGNPNPNVLGSLIKDFKNGWIKVQTYGPINKIEIIVEFKRKK